MILVTVGTEQFPFNRLLQWVERALQKGCIREEVLIQSGACTITIAGVTQIPLLEPDAFDLTIASARLVISHCGEGSFLKLRSLGKPFLLVPRRHSLGEHIDDHQWDLANALSTIGTPVGRMPQDVERFLRTPPDFVQVHLPGPSLTEHLLTVYPSSGFRYTVI
jgi:UDP-N-acetylglucosamine transferase subunit ALG13